MEFVFGRWAEKKAAPVRMFNGSILICMYIFFMIVPATAIYLHAFSKPAAAPVVECSVSGFRKCGPSAACAWQGGKCTAK